MKIHDAIHALILFDQKKIISHRSIFVTGEGVKFKFIRIDTQLNWPRIIVQMDGGEERFLTAKDLRSLSLVTEDPEMRFVPNEY